MITRKQTPNEHNASSTRHSRTTIAVGVILLLAIIIRLVFLYGLAQYPYLLLPHGWMPDHSAFDNSAIRLADRGRRMMGLPAIERKHPRAIYFHHNYAATGDGEIIYAKEYINLPDEPPMRPPLYVFFLGALYFIMGDNQVVIHLVQTALGLCNALLAYALARRLCGRIAALFPLAVGAFYWPLIIYENVHHDKTLVSGCLLLMAYCALRWADKRTLPNTIALGAVLGLTLYGARAMLLFVPALALWMAWVLYRKNGKDAFPVTPIARHICTLVLVVCLMLTPLVIRNYRAAGRFALFLGSGSTIWHTAMTIISDEDINKISFVESPLWDDNPEHIEAMARYDRNWSLADYESKWGARSLSHLLANPRLFLRHCLVSAVRFWAPKENQGLTTHYRYEYALRLISPALARLPGTFTVVFIPFVLGLGLFVCDSLRRKSPLPQGQGAEESMASESTVETLVFLVLLTAVWYAPYIIYLNRAVYRIPLILVMSVLSAWGFHRAYTCAQARNWRRLACGAAPAVILLPVMMMTPIAYDDDVINWLRVNTHHWDLRGTPERALAVAIRLAESRPHYAEVQNEAAILSLYAGNDDDAFHYYVRAMDAFSPSRTDYIAHVANQVCRLLLRLDEDDRTDTAPMYSHIHDYKERERHTMIALAGSFLFHDAPDKAASLLEAVRNSGPEDAASRHLHGLVLYAQGKTEPAITFLMQGIEDYPDDVALRLGLADIQAQQGNIAEACEGYRKVLELEPDNDEAQRAMARICEEP